MWTVYGRIGNCTSSYADVIYETLINYRELGGGQKAMHRSTRNRRRLTNNVVGTTGLVVLSGGRFPRYIFCFREILRYRPPTHKCRLSGTLSGSHEFFNRSRRSELPRSFGVFLRSSSPSPSRIVTSALALRNF